MNFRRNASRISAYILLTAALTISGFAGDKHSAPAPKSAPAPRAAAPKASAPAGQHNTGSSRPATSTNRSTPGAASHANTSTRPGATSHAGTPTHAGSTSGRTSTTGRTSTPAHAGTTGNSSMGHNGTTSHANTASRSASTAHTAPGRQVSLKGGGSASIRPNGQIRSVNRNGMQISHNLHGGRTIVGSHNGARVVTNGRHGGYVQRAYVTRGGRSYYSRTYYYHGGYRVGVYQGYAWGGRSYYGYYPGYYYGPAYYGWAYNPWAAPVAYGWGWGGAPWYGAYGGFFTPYPVYPSAAFWLADYLIAANLQAAYAAQAEAEAGFNKGFPASDLLVASLGFIPAPDAGVVMSPEVKNAVSAEIKAQLAEDQTAAGAAKSASGGGGPANKDEAPPALDPKRRTFVVADDMSVVADGQECSLTAGDVITRLTDTPDGDNNVNVSVAASKKADCAPGKTVAVAVDDLQEMHNHFREQLTSGMGELAKKQGTGGLPKSPDTTTTKGDVPEPEPDKSAAKTLDDQEKSADQTEAEVKQEAGSGGSQ